VCVCVCVCVCVHVCACMCVDLEATQSTQRSHLQIMLMSETARKESRCGNLAALLGMLYKCRDMQRTQKEREDLVLVVAVAVVEVVVTCGAWRALQCGDDQTRG
jgi:hypothetical protein